MRELDHLPGGHRLAEEEAREVRQVVGLVEDHRVGVRQEVGHALVAQRHVGEEQVVVHDHHVGLAGSLARLHHEAVLVVAAGGAQAVLARRGGLRPGAGALGHVLALAAVAAHGARGEALDALQVHDLLARAEHALLRVLLQVVQADVVGAPLEQRHVHRRAERLAHARQVAVEELVLQRLGAGGDDHAAAREQRRDEVGEGLAGSGARLRHQHAVRLDRLQHGARELDLLPALSESRHRARERPALAEERLEVDRGAGRSAHVRPNTMRSSRSRRATSATQASAMASAMPEGTAQSSGRKRRRAPRGRAPPAGRAPAPRGATSRP